MKANVGHKSSNLERKVGYSFHPVYTIGFLMCTLADSEDPHIMPHHAAFHLGLHCFFYTNMMFRERNATFFNKNL